MEISPCITSPVPRRLWINSFLFKCHNTRWQPRLFPLLYFQGWNPQYYWMSNGVGKKINWFRTKFLKETSWGGQCGPLLSYLWNWINLQSLFKALIYDSEADLTLNLNPPGLREEEDETKPSGASWQAQAKSRMSKSMKRGAPSIFQMERKFSKPLWMFEGLLGKTN